MEKWEDWRIGLAIDGVSSDLASRWPWTSVAPPIADGSTEKRGWDRDRVKRLESSQKGVNPVRLYTDRSGITGPCTRLYETGGRWTA